MTYINKKADMEVSLSWVFMLIIGTVFFVLAYTIIDKYQENENQKYELELKQSLRSILNNAGRTTGVEENSLQNAKKMFSGKSVEVKCIDSQSVLWIDNGKITDSENDFINNYPIFMTSIGESKSDDVFIAVESFRMPFKITNMVAIVSKKNLIVFDKDSKITEKYLYKFNKGSYKNLNYVSEYSIKDDISKIEDFAKTRNLESIVLVSDRKISDQITSFELNSLSVDAHLVEIEEKTSTSNFGTIYFLDKDGKSTQFNYIDNDDSLGLITMAVFSSPETFECSYNLILNSIPNVYDFYITKTNYLHNVSKTNIICSSSLISYDTTGITGGLQQLKYEALNTSLTKIKLNVTNQKFNNVENISNLLAQLNADFKEVERYNCPYVY